jgi:hypothetical protein
MRYLFTIVLVLTACRSPEPVDRLELPHGEWPILAPLSECGTLQQELDRLKIELGLLQALGRNSSPPF